MTREVEQDNTATTKVLMPFERDLNTVGKSTTAVNIKTRAEDVLNYNLGREGLCLNGSSSFRIPYNSTTPLNWHETWSICFWIKIESDIEIKRYPQILFNTFEQLTSSSTQDIQCVYLDNRKIRFIVNSQQRDSEDDSISLDSWHLITIIHVPSDKFRIFIDNQDKTGTYANDGRLSTAIQQSRNDLVFFKQYDNANRSSKAIKFYGFRFYQKELSIQDMNTIMGISIQNTALTEEQYNNYLNLTQIESKSLPSSFGGNVIKIDKGLASKRIVVHNYIHKLINTQSLQSYTRSTFFDIVYSEINKLTDVELVLLGTFKDYYFKTATIYGSIYDLINSLFSRTKNRFFVNIANQLILQSESLFNTKYSFVHGINSIILDTTQDSSSIVNNIVTTIDGGMYEFTRTHAYSWSLWNTQTIYIRNKDYVKQITVKAVSSTSTSENYTSFPFTGNTVISGTTFSYTGAFVDDLFRFTVSASPEPNVDIKLSFVLDIQFEIPYKTTRTDENTRSINRHGVRSKIINQNSLGNIPYDDVALNELSKGNLRLSYKIISPQLLKDIRVGDYVIITNTLKQINNVVVQVRKIQWMYPDGKTELWCGDTQYDIYSTYAQIGESIRNVLNVNPDNVPIVDDDTDPNTLLDGE